ncbi:MAG: DUF2834 domain-containing protein [Polycyclovorans sp.]|jgi:hypothetical protein|nr:DUF2834 domain-containing protein [Polycyclovorans sp.]MBU0789185.1 DUF2834 domain-containing protein [Gammaproteobacteria bacterium]MDP1541899.1 DUF2834 domain-containing protein [Polycyclovorans sp.]MEC8847941.1 DUF2834 domain-containing protein [Pseudomonadota bacterium]|tara:strand:- start:21075 stop:21395 length:321 start_codon:yes stop_codon:yes gene_type:complete
MSVQTGILAVVIVAFGALSGLALYEHGYWGIIAFHFPSSAGWQVLTDLVIVCGLAMLWMVQNARATGRTAWPYVLLTLAAGAFGPLLYLLMGSLRGRGASLASVRG